MIYLLKAQNLYKIGYANDIDKRMTAYKTHNPFVEWARYTKGSEKDEKKLHQKYKKYRTTGEWFQLPDEIITELIQKFQIVFPYFSTKPLTASEVQEAIKTNNITPLVEASKWYKIFKLSNEEVFLHLKSDLLLNQEYTYEELENTFKPIFEELGLEWSYKNSIDKYFPSYTKKRKVINGIKHTVYRFEI